MHKILLAFAGAASALSAAAAAGPIVSDGSRPIPNVRIHSPERAGTSWEAPMRSGSGYAAPRWDSRNYLDDEGDNFDAEVGFDEDGAPFDDESYYDRYYGQEARDAEWPDRLERSADADLDYDRDYPYDHRYGGGASAYRGGYMMIETITTTTTEPSVSRRTVYVPVAPAPTRHRIVRRRLTK